MDFRLCVALAFLAVLALATATQGETSDLSCTPFWTNPDDRGDVTILGVPLAPTSPLAPAPVDLLDASMVLRNGTVEYSFQTAEAPEEGASVPYYRYWLGFLVTPQGGDPEYMDLRISSTTTYDSGALIGSNERGLPSLGRVDVTWNGNRASFAFPLAIVQDLYDRPIEIGGVQAGADGRSLTPVGQGSLVGAVFIDYNFEMATGPTCLSAAPPPPEAASEPPERDLPTPGPVLALVAALFWAHPRRRH